MAFTVIDGPKLKSGTGLLRETRWLPLENPRSISIQTTSKRHSKMEYMLFILRVGGKCDALRSIYATDPGDALHGVSRLWFSETKTQPEIKQGRILSYDSWETILRHHWALDNHQEFLPSVASPFSFVNEL